MIEEKELMVPSESLDGRIYDLNIAKLSLIKPIPEVYYDEGLDRFVVQICVDLDAVQQTDLCEWIMSRPDEKDFRITTRGMARYLLQERVKQVETLPGRPVGLGPDLEGRTIALLVASYKSQRNVPFWFDSSLGAEDLVALPPGEQDVFAVARNLRLERTYTKNGLSGTRRVVLGSWIIGSAKPAIQTGHFLPEWRSAVSRLSSQCYTMLVNWPVHGPDHADAVGQLFKRAAQTGELREIAARVTSGPISQTGDQNNAFASFRLERCDAKRYGSGNDSFLNRLANKMKWIGLHKAKPSGETPMRGITITPFASSSYFDESAHFVLPGHYLPGPEPEVRELPFRQEFEGRLVESPTEVSPETRRVAELSLRGHRAQLLEKIKLAPSLSWRDIRATAAELDLSLADIGLADRSNDMVDSLMMAWQASKDAESKTSATKTEEVDENADK